VISAVTASKHSAGACCGLVRVYHSSVLLVVRQDGRPEVSVKHGHCKRLSDHVSIAWSYLLLMLTAAGWAPHSPDCTAAHMARSPHPTPNLSPLPQCQLVFYVVVPRDKALLTDAGV
jgi:hypothetical protein